jgi:hypothetical protein
VVAVRLQAFQPGNFESLVSELWFRSLVARRRHLEAVNEGRTLRLYND